MSTDWSDPAQRAVIKGLREAMFVTAPSLYAGIWVGYATGWRDAIAKLDEWLAAHPEADDHAPTPGLCACGRPGCSDGSDQSVVTTPASDGTHMSGPQHYAKAERLLASVAGADVYPPDGGIARVHAATVAEAQVHATLALAAATAYTAARDWIRCLHGAPPDESDWYCAAPAPVPDDEAVANLMPHLIGYDCRLEIDRHAAAESILDAGYVCDREYAGRHYYSIDGTCQRCGHGGITEACEKGACSSCVAERCTHACHRLVPDDEVERVASLIADGAVAYFRTIPYLGGQHWTPEVIAEEHEIATRGQGRASARRVLAAGWISPEAHAQAVRDAVRATAERIAEAIEARRIKVHGPGESRYYWAQAMDDAARIAREAVSDER